MVFARVIRSVGSSVRLAKFDPAPITSALPSTQPASSTGVELVVMVSTTSAPRTAASALPAATTLMPSEVACSAANDSRCD